MPGRGGHSVSGGWASSGNGSTVPFSLSLSTRLGNDPLVYTASESIEFIQGFENGTGDSFEAYLADGSNNGGDGTGGSGLDGTLAQSSYRYGFNGKENDNEVKGEGTQQDYGMRIYDPRLGKFLSVDPLTKKYPELTPYQFASNTPIESVDLDGAERMGYIKKFEYNGSISDHPVDNVPNAIANGVIDLINLVPDLWNSGVTNVESIKHGTWGKDRLGELRSIRDNIGNYVYNTVNYTLNTPIKQQLVDAGKTLDNPQTLEIATTLYLGGKIPLGEGIKKLQKIRWSTELPEGIVTNGPSFSSSGGKVPLRSAPMSLEQMANGCEALARKVQKSIGGDFLQITPKEGVRLGPVNYSGGQVTEWAYHVAVLKDGMVYDGMTGAKGMHLGEYKKMFEYHEAINFTPTKQITLK